MATAPRCLYKVHVADGFVDDCDELMHRCSKLETVTFAAFCDIWKNLHFASIYKGRYLSAEIAELSEEVIHIAKQYLVANTSNFEESVAGLFLVYGLLNLQPFKGFAALRLIPDDMPAINRIELVARRERRLEVLYILGSVLICGPCQFHAMMREHGLESSYRKYIEGFTSLDKQGIRPKGVFYRQNEELDIIRELNSLTRLYSDAKAKIHDGNEIDRNLSYVDKGLPAELDTSLKKIINGLIDDEVYDSEGSVGSKQSNHVSAVQAIKARAMKTAVIPMKHLTGIREKKANSVSPKKKPEITSKAGKVKSGSPRKPLATIPSSLKRTKPMSDSIEIHTQSMRRKNYSIIRPKKRKYSSSSSDSGGELSLAGMDDDDDEDDESENGDQINNVKSVPADTDEESDPIILDPNNSQTIEIEVNEDETQIEVELIPVVIHKDKSQMVEIEIVDHYQKNEIIESVESKIMKLPDITLIKKGECLKNNAKDNVTETTTEKDNIFKKPYLLKKPEKSELKKQALKSKFKKMGMLSVANFKDKKK